MPGFSRRRLLTATAGAIVGGAGVRLLGAAAGAARPAPRIADPIVAENRLTAPDTWTDAFRLSGYDGRVCGFATRTSVDRGEAVNLKIAYYDAGGLGDVTANLGVFRLGHYNGHGGRLVHALVGVPMVAHPVPPADALGLRSCAGWPVAATVPGSATAVSGLYLVKVITSDGKQSHIPFIVRDDARPRDLLVALPVNTWQAYNAWGGASLYFAGSAGTPTVAGTNAAGLTRAVKVSFDRPYLTQYADYNWPLRTEFPLIAWLERQGYDLSYTDDVGLHSQPEQLLPDRTRTLVIAGHSEYWTAEAFANVQAAVAAGTNLASFSANTAYWQVRYEDEQAGAPRTLVCFKTVQGTGAGGVGNAVNDFGPGAAGRGGPNDPVGADGRAHTPDDRPQYATTTRRDSGAAAGTANAPPEGRVGVGAGGRGNSENRLFGVLYIGDNDTVSYPLVVPPGAGRGGEFGAHPAWRHTSVDTRGAAIGHTIVGWEWDAIPGPSTPYAASQPAGVRRLAQTDPLRLAPPAIPPEYIQDEGRLYGPRPPAGQPPVTQAVTYRAPSGAHVFSSGTMQWSWGLGAHFLETDHSTYEQPPVDASDSRIQQATANILADGGVVPATPEGVVIDRRAGRRSG